MWETGVRGDVLAPCRRVALVIHRIMVPGKAAVVKKIGPGLKRECGYGGAIIKFGGPSV